MATDDLGIRLIRVLLLERESHWVAQGLDIDFAATGKTLFETMRNFERNLVAQVALDAHHGNAPLEDFKRAPDKFWAMWGEQDGTMPMAPRTVLPGGVPEAHVIKALITEARIYR